MSDVAMPRLSDSMEEGTILKWLKSDGDEVRRGDELVEIETDKANMTYEADSDGQLAIVAQEGDTLAVGEPIARIGAADAVEAESAPAEAEPQEAVAQVETASAGSGQRAAAERDPVGYDAPQPAPASSTPAPVNGRASDQPASPEPATGDGNGADRIKASPIARRMARDMGLELGGLTGSGPGGRIVKADVENADRNGVAAASTAPAPAPAAEPVPVTTPAAPAPDQAPAEPALVPSAEIPDAPAMYAQAEGATAKGDSTRQPLSRMQQTIARRMAESKATAPDFQLTVEVDMEAAVALGGQLREAAGDGPAPSFNDFVIKSAALALREFPRVNGAYRDGEFELYTRVNVGIAVAGVDSLVVPTVFDADRKPLGTIAADARALAKRARAGVLTPPELAGGTFSISNLGMYGIKRFNAVVNPPQAAILAVGTIEPRAVVRDGRIVARTMMDLTISCDHRILNGADGAEFLVRVQERLERPMALVL